MGAQQVTPKNEAHLSSDFTKAEYDGGHMNLFICLGIFVSYAGSRSTSLHQRLGAETEVETPKQILDDRRTRINFHLPMEAGMLKV